MIYSPNKKAFGSVVSALIMFIAVISVTVGLVMIFQNFVVNTQGSLSKQNKLTSNKLSTSISIINTFYNSTSNNSYYYVKNIGDTALTTSLMNLFIDGMIQSNFTIVTAYNLTKNATLFQPQDTIAIINNKAFNAGSHEVKLITQYGVGDILSFNI